MEEQKGGGQRPGTRGWPVAAYSRFQFVSSTKWFPGFALFAGGICWGLCVGSGILTAMADFAGRLWDLLGTMHPMLVHFPVALLIAAAFFEIVRLRQGATGTVSPSGCFPIGQSTDMPSHVEQPRSTLLTQRYFTIRHAGWRRGHPETLRRAEIVLLPLSS